jgi:hypothetical protein
LKLEMRKRDSDIASRPLLSIYYPPESSLSNI